jgi:hypothetical protein
MSGQKYAFAAMDLAELSLSSSIDESYQHELRWLMHLCRNCS